MATPFRSIPLKCYQTCQLQPFSFRQSTSRFCATQRETLNIVFSVVTFFIVLDNELHLNMFTTVTFCVLPTALRALDVSFFLSMMERTTLFDLDSEQRIVAFYLVVLVFLVSSALILSKLEARDCIDTNHVMDIIPSFRQ